jgi:hypothetical protein
MLVARIFAENGLTRVFKMILANSIKFADETRWIEINGKRIEIDPRTWHADMKLKVKVGLGTGNREEAIRKTAEMLKVQAEVAGRLPGMVTAKQAYNALVDFVRSRGNKTPERYFISPESPEFKPPQPQPSELMQKADMDNKARIQIETIKDKRERQKASFEAKIALEKLRNERIELQIKKMEVSTGVLRSGGQKVTKAQRMGGNLSQ